MGRVLWVTSSSLIYSSPLPCTFFCHDLLFPPFHLVVQSEESRPDSKFHFMVFSVVWQPMVTTIAGTRVAMSTADMLQTQKKGMEAGLIELAVTGRAFNELCHTGNMSQFLFYTRIFSRFTPEDKVDCGDYGNWKFIWIQLGKSCNSRNLIKY